MNKILLVLLSFAFSATVNAQSIENMYFDIPAEMLGLDKDISKADRKKLIAELDNKNGFMKLKGENAMELAKFNLKGNEPVLAVAETSYADGRTLKTRLTFLTKKSDQWSDVTEVYLQEIPGLVIDAFSRKTCGVAISNSASGTYRYRLPRKGRTIRAVAESDVLTKPCDGDLFHLEFEAMRIVPNNTWHDYLVLKFANQG